MEPIPETVRAISNLGPSADDATLLADLARGARRAKEMVPDLVGVSVTALDRGLTFTLVATASDVAVLDAIQYLAGGPCVEGAHRGQVTEYEHDDVLNEERWRLF